MKLKIGFFAIMLALSFLLDPSPLSLCSLLAALLHELGHIAMARICHIRLRECKVGIYGAGLIPDGSLYSYGQEILLCLAGPLTNLLTACLLLPIKINDTNEFLQGFFFASLVLGLLNLLPIKGFDGGRVLHALLSLRLQPHTVSLITSACSFLCIFSLWSASVYLLLRAAASLSLFIFSLSLFSRIFLNEE